MVITILLIPLTRFVIWSFCHQVQLSLSWNLCLQYGAKTTTVTTKKQRWLRDAPYVWVSWTFLRFPDYTDGHFSQIVLICFCSDGLYGCAYVVDVGAAPYSGHFWRHGHLASPRQFVGSCASLRADLMLRSASLPFPPCLLLLYRVVHAAVACVSVEGIEMQ